MRQWLCFLARVSTKSDKLFWKEMLRDDIVVAGAMDSLKAYRLASANSFDKSNERKPDSHLLLFETARLPVKVDLDQTLQGKA